MFAAGPEWQFRGWRWGRGDGKPDITPAEIFSRCESPGWRRVLSRTARLAPHGCAGVGVYVYNEGDPIPATVAKWNVKPLPISKTKR